MMKTLALLLVLSVVLSAPGRAQEDSKTPRPATPTTPPEGPGTPHTRTHISGEVYIGERAPDFELDGSNGKPVKLSSLRGDWVLLVFDGRKEGLSPLRTIEAETRKLGARIATVCDEKAYHLEAYVKREQIPFVMMADPTGEISAMYGCYDAERSTTSPGWVLMDREGTVRMAMLGQRLLPEDVLRLVRFAITGL